MITTNNGLKPPWTIAFKKQLFTMYSSVLTATPGFYLKYGDCGRKLDFILLVKRMLHPYTVIASSESPRTSKDRQLLIQKN